jgi:hypothetical protein
MSTALQMPESRTVTQRPSLAPRTIQEALDFSSYLAKSELIPRDYQNKPHNIFVAVQYGMELGLQPLQALQSIAVINGRPSMWGDAVLAVVMSHPMYEWHTEVIEGEGDNRVGVFTIKRRNQEPHVARFSVADARKAGLWGKSGPWTQHADRMLKLRARGFALRDKFPDALKGIISREEAEDYPTPEPRIHPAPVAPAPAAAQAEPAMEAPLVHAPVAAEQPKAGKITHEQARAFARAWRTSGYTVDDAKAWLKSNLGLTSSLSIPTDRYEEAVAWASTPKQQRTMSPEEALCHALFDRLGLTLAEQAEAIVHADGDWKSLAEQLQSELPAEGNQELFEEAVETK